MKKNFYAMLSLLLLSFTTRAQSIVSVSPSSISVGQTLNVTITGSGTHFVSGSNTTVRFGFESCSGTVVNSFFVNNSTTVTANISVLSPFIYNNFHDVEIYEPIDGYVLGDYLLNVSGGNTYPVSLSPNSGAAGQTLNVTITGTGTHFLQSSGTVNVELDLDQRVCYQSVNTFTGNASSNTLMTTNITIPPGTQPGWYDIFIFGTSDNFGRLQNLFHVTGPTSIEELDGDNNLSIAPNPFSNSTLISYQLNHADEVVIEVFDLFGRRILSEHPGRQLPGQHGFKIDAASLDLRNGIYFVRFSAGSRNLIRKILVDQ